jgi:hypothetical protein
MKSQEELKLANAKKKVKSIKGFYTHLSIFVLVNILILAGNTHFFTEFITDEYGFWRYLSTPVFWGIGLLIHWLVVFTPTFGFVKSWEERKMKQLMEDDTNN